MFNILFIHQSAELYGSDKTLLLLLQNIDRSKFNPVVVLPFDGPLKHELEIINIEVVISPVLKLYRQMFTPSNLLKFLKDYKSGMATLNALHQKHQFGLVYSNTLAVLIGIFFSRNRKIKHLWHVHEIIVHPKPIAVLFPFLLNKYSDYIVCNSKATLQNLTLRNKEIQKKATIIYNGIPENKSIVSTSDKTSFGFKNTDIIITLVGRISRLKGHMWLLNTYLTKLSHLYDVKILFVGSPVVGQEFYLEEVNQFILANQLEQNVKIIPFTSDLTPIWSITDIAVMPSTEAESFGLVALEAMLAKKPVIGSNIGGLTEIVVDQQTGFLVTPLDKNQFAKALLQLINDSQLRIQLGKQGYQRATIKFSLQQYYTNFEEYFSAI